MHNTILINKIYPYLFCTYVDKILHAHLASINILQGLLSSLHILVSVARTSLSFNLGQICLPVTHNMLEDNLYYGNVSVMCTQV